MVCFYGFQCNSFAVCESLKWFFCDLQTAWRLVLSMKPWSYIWLEFGLFSTIIAIIRACACWALYVVTLTNTVHLIYIYIYVCWPVNIYVKETSGYWRQFWQVTAHENMSYWKLSIWCKNCDLLKFWIFNLLSVMSTRVAFVLWLKWCLSPRSWWSDYRNCALSFLKITISYLNMTC